MFQVFAGSGARKKYADDEQQRTDVPDQSADGEVRHMHICILGTGFSGLGMAIRLKQRGYKDFVVLEKAEDIGGTWRDNTYPGCACDIPSHLYSFSFALNPNWSHMYSPQREIQEYLCDCAQRFGILPHIWWNNELRDASWSDDEQRWHITTSQREFTTDILILGNGPLSEPALPHISGIENFEGEIFHSAKWRHDLDLTGKRVAVIGTGASAIQFVPQIQPKVAHLVLFQRTPPWIVPRLDHPISEEKKRLYRLLPFTQRFVRTRIYLRQELTALGMVYNQKAMEKGMQFAREHLERQVADPELRAKFTPHYAMGCKRILVSDDFYPAAAQPNVEVVTEHIREVRGRSVVTEDGQEHEVDVIICGTGFHVTDARLPQCVRGRGGQTLADAWSESIHAYMGTAVPGFPNLFLLIGPNTGLGHNSMVYMIESQLSYLLDCFRTMERKQAQVVEIRSEVEAAYNDEVQQRMQKTVWASGCVSWYLDARGRNTTLWPGFTFEFRRRTRRFDRQNYDLLPQYIPLTT